MSKKPPKALARYNNASIVAAFSLIIDMLVDELVELDPRSRKRMIGRLNEATVRLGEPDYHNVEEVRSILALTETLLRASNNLGSKVGPRQQ